MPSVCVILNPDHNLGGCLWAVGYTDIYKSSINSLRMGEFSLTQICNLKLEYLKQLLISI